MVITGGMFQFAFDNGYVLKNPFDGISLLKRSKAEPDPLTRDEFFRLIKACNNTQVKNLWSLAFYTGLRHGELCALAWEDIDLKAETLIVRRNYTRVNEFTLPKTDSGTDRIIHLVQPAIDVLKSQTLLTRLGKQYDIQVKLREYGRTITPPYTFVVNPQLTRRAGIRHRKAYQSRHTYACWALAAGVNPTFIATQMGHRNVQMVYNVYGAWMSENNADQVSILNSRLSSFAPQMPQEGII